MIGNFLFLYYYIEHLDSQEVIAEAQAQALGVSVGVRWEAATTC